MAAVPITARRRTRTALLRSAALVGLASATLGAGPAAARTPAALARSPALWATVNVCDTAGHPDTVGIRASIPGSGVARERMFMRFVLEYLPPKGGSWRAIGASGDSGWISVGSSRRHREAGRNFTVRPPGAGAFHLRAAARFEWRRGSKVTARASKRTSAGHAGTAGADPAGYSASTCDVKA